MAQPRLARFSFIRNRLNPNRAALSLGRGPAVQKVVRGTLCWPRPRILSDNAPASAKSPGPGTALRWRGGPGALVPRWVFLSDTKKL